MDLSKKRTAEEVLNCILTDVTTFEDVADTLRKALAGEGFNGFCQDSATRVFFPSELDPTYPEDQPLWDALEPNTVIVYAEGPISESITKEEEFIYAYPCDELCDKLQHHLNNDYYPRHPLAAATIQPLMKQLRAAMPDPGALPDTATRDDKIRYVLAKWLRDFSTWLISNLKTLLAQEDVHIPSNISVCFPWTQENARRGTQPSDPGTVRLTARGQDARLVREDNPFITILLGDQFCDMVHDWLKTNWYPDHKDEQADVENSLTQLRHALTTP